MFIDISILSFSTENETMFQQIVSLCCQINPVTVGVLYCQNPSAKHPIYIIVFLFAEHRIYILIFLDLSRAVCSALL